MLTGGGGSGATLDRGHAENGHRLADRSCGDRFYYHRPNVSTAEIPKRRSHERGPGLR